MADGSLLSPQNELRKSRLEGPGSNGGPTRDGPDGALETVAPRLIACRWADEITTAQFKTVTYQGGQALLAP